MKKILIFLSMFIIFSCSEEKKDACKRVTCSNHGECYEENGKARCSCDSGYKEESLQCIKNDITCDENNCGENEKCVIEDDEKKCVCKEDFHRNTQSDSCDPNKKLVYCIDEAPSNAKSDIQEVEVVWDENSNSYSGTPKCEWDCNEGYLKDEEGVSCVLACNGECKNYEKCENNTCMLKEGRCLDDSNCGNEICDKNSNWCYPAKKSWDKTPSANGFGTIVYNETENKITTYYPHIYRQFNENSEHTPNLAYDMYFGIRIDGTNTWLNEVSPSGVRYIHGTGITEVTKELSDILIKEYYFMTMNAQNPLAIAGIVVENKSSSNKEISAFALGNFRVGTGNEHKTNEKADYNDTYNGFYERNWENGYSYYHIFFASGIAPDVVSLNKDDYNPYLEVKNNNNLTEHKNTQKDDIALFYQKNLGNIAPNSKSSYYVAWNALKDPYEPTHDNPEDYVENIAPSVNNFIKDKSLENLIEEEQEYWNNWHSVENLPQDISEREKKLAIQSAAFIKMAQVREDIGGKGQILASLPVPSSNGMGGWNVSWIRDMSYAVIGLVKSKHLNEAKLGLEFIFGDRETGKYNSYEWDTLGHDYQVSVCRYYGNGSEETDANGAGYNVEYDGFGLALWMLDEYIKDSNDTDFITAHKTAIFDKTADVILKLIGSDGLMAPDSSIWEYHWADDGYNGKRHFAYTSITAYRGLVAAKRMGDLIGIDTSKYQEGLEKLQNGINTHLVKNNVLRNFKDGDVSQKAPENGQNLHYIDASSVEAFNLGVIDPNSKIANKTLEAFEEELGNLESNSPGFKRTNKKCKPTGPWDQSCIAVEHGDYANEYDVKEWIMVDFRILEFLRARTDKKSKDRADQLYNWILTQSELNNFQIAELYNEEDANYTGSIPMCGFGPGAFLIELLRK